MPAERAVRAILPAAATVWTAAEIMHACHLSSVDIALTSLAVAGFAGLRASHATEGPGQGPPPRPPCRGGVAVTGGWLAVAAHAGPLAGPDCAMSLTWAGASLGGWLWLRRHEVVVAAEGLAPRPRRLAGTAANGAWGALTC